MSQDSWEDSVWAQDEPSPPESDGADGDHRGDEVQDQAGDLDDAPEAMCSAAGAVDEPGGGGFVDLEAGRSSGSDESAAREWRGTVILLGLPEAEYRPNNSVVKRAIREALEQQGQNEVRLSKVQAYVLEALGVNLSKETLRPIVEFMLDELAYERDRDAAEAIGQPITAEYLRRKHSSYMSWLTQPGRTEPSPFDGVTKINKHNAWRYALYKPGLQSYKRRETRSPLSEPARFYRQLTGLEWDGESRSYDLACKAFRRLLPAHQHEEREREERRKQQRHDARLASALPSAVTAASKPTHAAPKPSATLTASPKPTHAAAQPLSSDVPDSVLGSVTAVDPIVVNALMMGMPYEALASSKDPKKADSTAPQPPSALQPHAAISTTLAAASAASQPHATSQSLSSAVPDETKPRRGDQRFGDYRAFRLAEKAWYERRRRERLKTSRAPYSTNASRRSAGTIVASSVVPAAKDDTVLPLPDPPSWWWPLPRPHTPSWLSPPLPSSTSREQMLSRRAAQEQRRQEEERRGRVEAEILAMPPLAPELMMSGAGDVDNAAAQTQMQAELARPMRWCTRVPTTS